VCARGDQARLKEFNLQEVGEIPSLDGQEKNNQV